MNIKVHRDGNIPLGFKTAFFKFKLKWSGDISLPTAEECDITGYSNRFNDFTYRIDPDSIEFLPKEVDDNTRIRNEMNQNQMPHYHYGQRR